YDTAGGVALMVVGTLIFFATLIAWNARALERVEDERARLIREQGARAEAEAAERRAAFLAQASAALSASLDYNSTLKSVPALAVPRLADWCALSSLDPEGTVRQLAVAHVDPAKEELAWEMEKRYPASLSAPYGPGRVIRTGAPELVGDIPDPLLEAVAQDEEHLRILRALGVTSYMAVPLIARGQTLGAIAFGAAGSGRRFGRDELTVAEELAHRAALAADNARHYEAEGRARAAAEAGTVTGDPERLKQVVWNLASNAVKFTPKGGRVEVRLERVDGRVEITVRDSGQGIRPEFLPHIFQRFEQADSTSTRAHGGLG